MSQTFITVEYFPEGTDDLKMIFDRSSMKYITKINNITIYKIRLHSIDTLLINYPCSNCNNTNLKLTELQSEKQLEVEVHIPPTSDQELINQQQPKTSCWKINQLKIHFWFVIDMIKHSTYQRIQNK